MVNYESLLQCRQLPSTPPRNWTVTADHSPCSFLTPIPPVMDSKEQQHHCWELESTDFQIPLLSRRGLGWHPAWRRSPECSVGLGRTCSWIGRKKTMTFSMLAWVWPPRCPRFHAPLELLLDESGGRRRDELALEESRGRAALCPTGVGVFWTLKVYLSPGSLSPSSFRYTTCHLDSKLGEASRTVSLHCKKATSLHTLLLLLYHLLRDHNRSSRTTEYVMNTL
jgi:hypothetical protein